MPTYVWICDCGHEIEHIAKVDDRDVPPVEPCVKCGGKVHYREHFQRPTKGAKGFILEGDTGWHNKEYTKNRSIR